MPKSAALWGLPLGDKDLWQRAGVRTTFGSRLMNDFVPEASDDIVVAMDEAGAISLGKTSAPEFGLPAYTESLVGPPARTPWDVSLGAGGSSGGAAVAVSAGLLPVAPGSDGGGSIRIPAAATGLVGLKPSRGRVPTGSGFLSLGGLVAAGPLARTVADAALLLDAISGPSPWSVGPPSWDGGALLNAAVRGEGRFQLGVMTTSPWDDALRHHGVAGGGGGARRRDEASGCARPRPRRRSGCGATPATPRPSARSGRRGPPISRQRASSSSCSNRSRDGWSHAGGSWMPGNSRPRCSSSRMFERSVIHQFSTYDAILTPSLAMTPRPVGWYSQDDPELNFAQQVQYTPWTSFVNVSGLPAISLPLSMTAEGLPMGVQLIGRPGREDVLLAIGAQLERRCGWQHRHPPQW